MFSLDLLPFQKETSPPPCLVLPDWLLRHRYPLSPKVEGELWHVVVSMMMGRYAADWGEPFDSYVGGCKLEVKEMNSDNFYYTIYRNLVSV